MKKGFIIIFIITLLLIAYDIFTMVILRYIMPISFNIDMEYTLYSPKDDEGPSAFIASYKYECNTKKCYDTLEKATLFFDCYNADGSFITTVTNKGYEKVIIDSRVYIKNAPDSYKDISYCYYRGYVVE